MSNPDHSFTDEEMRLLLSSIDHRVPAIGATDVIMRARRGSGWRSALLAASAVLAVATASAAAVRAGYVTHFLDRIRAHAATPAPHGEEAATGVNASRGIAFVPGARVDVEFRAAQRSGALQVRWSDAPSVLLTQTGAEGEAHYALTPTGVIVDNERSSASYMLVLPRSVARARVRVGGREVLAKYGDSVSCGGAREAHDVCTIVLAAAGPR